MIDRGPEPEIHDIASHIDDAAEHFFVDKLWPGCDGANLDQGYRWFEPVHLRGAGRAFAHGAGVRNGVRRAWVGAESIRVAHRVAIERFTYLNRCPNTGNLGLQNRDLTGAIARQRRGQHGDGGGIGQYGEYFPVSFIVADQAVARGQQRACCGDDRAIRCITGHP
ncbi:hypothetical protein D3C78_1529750 [compost metagenome]